MLEPGFLPLFEAVFRMFRTNVLVHKWAALMESFFSLAYRIGLVHDVYLPTCLYDS